MPSGGDAIRQEAETSRFEHHVDKGSGPAIILNHGTLMDATMFDPQVDYLTARGYRTIALNSRTLLGNVAPHSLADLADDTAALADDLGLDKFVVAGMSVGAFATIEFALTFPERCEAVILIGGMAVDFPIADRSPFQAEFDKLQIDGPVPRDIAEWAAPYAFGVTSYRDNPALVRHWIDRWTTLTPARAVWSQSTAWIHKVDHSPRLGEIEVPVLMIHGEEDLPLPFERVVPMMNQIADATLHRVPNAGHSVNVESPEITNRAMLGFLDRVYGR